MKMKLIVALSLACVGVASLTSATSFAADDTNESITLSPVSRSYKFDAGKTYDDSLTVINDGKSAYDFTVYTRPYSVTNEAYEPNFTSTPANADAYSWVQFPKAKYHIEAGATVTVNYSIHVSPLAIPGGHYGVIFAETQPAGEVSGNAVVRKKRVGSIIYATVNGTYQTNGATAGSEIPFWQLQPPLHTSVSFKNTGNADFTDTTRLTVKDLFGNTKYDVTNEHKVLPGTTRKINLDWTESPWFGLFKVQVEQKALDHTESSSGYVLMLPRYIPTVMVAVILLGGVYAWFRRKKH